MATHIAPIKDPLNAELASPGLEKRNSAPAGDKRRAESRIDSPAKNAKSKAAAPKNKRDFQPREKCKRRCDEFPVYLCDDTELRGVLFERNGLVLGAGSPATRSSPSTTPFLRPRARSRLARVSAHTMKMRAQPKTDRERRKRLWLVPLLATWIGLQRWNAPANATSHCALWHKWPV